MIGALPLRIAIYADTHMRLPLAQLLPPFAGRPCQICPAYFFIDAKNRQRQLLCTCIKRLPHRRVPSVLAECHALALVLAHADRMAPKKFVRATHFLMLFFCGLLGCRRGRPDSNNKCAKNNKHH